MYMGELKYGWEMVRNWEEWQLYLHSGWNNKAFGLHIIVCSVKSILFTKHIEKQGIKSITNQIDLIWFGIRNEMGC